MISPETLFSSAFEVDNAKKETAVQLAKRFIWTPQFARALTAKNHIFLGSRGSGKTALIKMLAHDHLSRSSDPRAKEIIKRRLFIGTYIKTRVEWAGILSSSPDNDPHLEAEFRWRLNLAACQAFVGTIKSCLNCYIRDEIERAKASLAIARDLGKDWLDEDCGGLSQLEARLEDVEYEKAKRRLRTQYTEEVRAHNIGHVFDSEWFLALGRGITVLKRHIPIPDDCTWVLCIDEAEYLSVNHHRLLNSLFRVGEGLTFKVTTMPYCHYTTETTGGVAVVDGQDFDYVYIDKIYGATTGQQYFDSIKTFTMELFDRRNVDTPLESADFKLSHVVGQSSLLREESSDWSKNSKLWFLLQKSASPRTKERAETLFGTAAFGEQISRKLSSALKLREEISTKKGNEALEAYSGVEIVTRCGDGNPRRLLAIFNLIVRNASSTMVGLRPVSPRDQTRMLRSVAALELARLKESHPGGHSAYELITTAGAYFSFRLHNRLLSTDQVQSLRVRHPSEEQWQAIKAAVGRGLLFPKEAPHHGDQPPSPPVELRLANVLAPYFKLVPRHGKAVTLETILFDARKLGVSSVTGQQLEIFGENGCD